MEMMTLIIAFCVGVQFVLASCVSDQVIEQKSAQRYGSSGAQQGQLTLPLLLRKPQEVADMKSSAIKDIMLHKLLVSSSGYRKAVKETNVAKYAAKQAGTWREWIENPGKSEYFTEDYAWIRRRRPIHNKQIPFVP